MATTRIMPLHVGKGRTESRAISDTICIENELSIVENPKLHGKSYNKWLGDQAKPSHRELLRVAIDNALSQSPADFEELLRLLQEYGCEVSKRGKSYRLKLSGWEKAGRMDSLGEGYGLEDLRAVLSGKKAHTRERKQSHRQSRRKSICWWTFRQNCRLEKVLAMLDGLKFLI